MNPFNVGTPRLDLPAIRHYTAGVQRAVHANRGREQRERTTNSWWRWNENARRRKS